MGLGVYAFFMFFNFILEPIFYTFLYIIQIYVTDLSINLVFTQGYSLKIGEIYP